MGMDAGLGTCVVIVPGLGGWLLVVSVWYTGVMAVHDRSIMSLRFNSETLRVKIGEYAKFQDRSINWVINDLLNKSLKRWESENGISLLKTHEQYNDVYICGPREAS